MRDLWPSNLKISLLVIACVGLPVAGLPISGECRASTLVRFDTVLGNIDVRLFDSATPASVANFLNYVADGDYVDSFIHRSPPDFVIQGGGFSWPDGGSLVSIPTDPPVVNEPGLSNLRGTLAYAKLGGDPNSATSGWFFNVTDDNANASPGPMLDTQNGGFTVFGTVVGDGLQVVDAISNLTIVNAGGAFTQLPILDSFDGITIFRSDLVFINSVTVLSLPNGDYDLDGDVDADDYIVWRTQFGNSLRIEDHVSASPDTLLEADGNGDGVVDIADYTIWRDAFVAAPGNANTLLAPEPSAALLLLAAAGIAPRRRRPR